MTNQELLNKCAKSAQDCITASEKLIGKIDPKEAVQVYIAAKENFKKLAEQADDNNIKQISKTIIAECENMINQCNAKPLDIYQFSQPSKLQIWQSIVNNAVNLIEKCEQFLSFTT